jgi:hypothetical protein
MSIIVTEEYNVMVNSEGLIPQNMWHYIWGVAYTDVIITVFDCIFLEKEMQGTGKSVYDGCTGLR